MNNPKQLLPTGLIAVVVPKDTNDYNLFFEHGYSRIDYNKLSEDKLPITDYTFQNIVKEECEFEILGEVTADKVSFDPIKFVNAYGNDKHLDLYGYEETTLKNRVEQFYSLLYSNGLYFENPIEKPDVTCLRNEKGFCQCGEESVKDCRDIKWQWKEAESKVIKGKLVIIKNV